MCMCIRLSPTGTMIDGPLSPKAVQHLSQDGAPAVSLTSSVDLHMVKTSSDASEQGSFSETEKVSSGEPEKETEKVSSGEPENDPTVPPVDASSSGSQMDQQARKHTEDTQQSTQFEGCPASEGSKDAVDADGNGKVLQQHFEETILEENLVKEAVNAPGNVFLFWAIVTAHTCFFVYCRSMKTLPVLCTI